MAFEPAAVALRGDGFKGLRHAVALLIGALLFAAHAADSNAVAPMAASPSKPTVNAASVLLRIDLQVGEKHVPPRSFWSNSLRLYLADIDQQEAVHRVRPLEPLPGAAGTQGWISLALAPGTYFLLIVPPGMEQGPPAAAYHLAGARFGRLRTSESRPSPGAVWDFALEGFVYRGAAPPDFEPIEGFLLRVPAEQAIVYAGSLRVACTSGGGLFGNRINECSDTSVADETPAAQSAAKALHGGQGSMHVSLVSRYGHPMAPLDIRGSGLEVIAVAPLPDGGGVDFALGTGQTTPLLIGPHPGVVVFNLLSLVGREAASAAARSEAQRQMKAWGPCIDGLAQGVRSLDLMALVSSAKSTALAPLRSSAPGPPMPSDAGMVAAPRFDYGLGLNATPHYLRLRECSPRGAFCLELAMRIHLRDIAAQRDIFDAVVVYSAVWPPADAQQAPYLIAAVARAECKTLETWCGPDGLELLRRDAAAGVDAIVSTAVERAARR
jgi:hypothetical protein